MYKISYDWSYGNMYQGFCRPESVQELNNQAMELVKMKLVGKKFRRFTNNYTWFLQESGNSTLTLTCEPTQRGNLQSNVLF